MNAVLLIAFGAIAYLSIGALLLLAIDGRPRWWGLLDRLTGLQECAAVALWPFAVPYLVMRYAPRR